MQTLLSKSPVISPNRLVFSEIDDRGHVQLSLDSHPLERINHLPLLAGLTAGVSVYALVAVLSPSAGFLFATIALITGGVAWWAAYTWALSKVYHKLHERSVWIGFVGESASTVAQRLNRHLKNPEIGPDLAYIAQTRLAVQPVDGEIYSTIRSDTLNVILDISRHTTVNGKVKEIVSQGLELAHNNMNELIDIRELDYA